MIEKIFVILIGLPFLACAIGSFVYFFKMRGEVKDAPWIVEFFHLYTFDSRYLSDKGKQYCTRYWQLFFGAMILAVFIGIFMILVESK